MASGFDRFRTGGALQGAAAESLLRERQRAAELAQGAMVGLYRILGELGRGGMAIVYRAERADGEYEQQVALKWMIDPRPDAASEALFRRERQALADLRHPHIARLLDGGRSADGRPWFAMELIEGERIDHHCQARKLPLRRRLALFDQVCGAVGFAHARGVIHRDIKPSNVLIDADGGARLLDFGIAQLLGREDQPVVHAFTPGFASPEQRRGEAATVASDIFQLGMLLAAVLQEPEGAIDSEAATVSVTGAQAETAWPSIPRGLPADLQAVLHKALDPDPARRHDSAAALAADLRAVVEHRPVSARPRRAGYLLARFVRRHPLGTGASLAAALFLIVATAAFTLRLASERDRAEYQARVANAVLQFLREDLLAAADPAAAPGRELTVREALDAAAQSVERRFAEAPTENAAIRSTLAWLYLDLGRVEEGEEQARLALAAAQDLPPSEERDWELNRLLHRSLLEQTRFEEALAVLGSHSAKHPPDARRAIDLDLHRALSTHGQGRYEEAERLAQAAIDRIGGLPAGASTALSALRSARADSLLMLGRQEEALELARALLAEEQHRFGPKHPRSLVEANRVGQILRHLRRLDEAETLLAETLRLRSEVLGEQHHQTLASANELATVLQEQQRYPEAEALFRRVLDARLALFGEQHLYTRNSMSNLGLLYQIWGRLDEATVAYERALAIELALPGERHPDTLALMHNVAGLYRRQQRFEQALALHAQVIEEAVHVLGPGAWQLGLFRAGRAQTLQRSGDAEGAESEFERAIDILAASLGEDSPRTRRARDMLEELRAERAGGTGS
jgi:eukaryotic-like serine/threonine-protein kinase